MVLTKFDAPARNWRSRSPAFQPIPYTMYLILIFLFPVLFLFNTRLAMVGLVAAIVWMYVQRTKPQTRTRQTQPTDAGYEAGYK